MLIVMNKSIPTCTPTKVTRPKPTALGLVATLICVSPATYSQSGSDAVASSRTAIEEIVVTARQRSENLQDVPLSITAFSADDLEQRNVRSLYEVAQFTAGLNFNDYKVGSLSVPTIRGLSQTSVTSLTNNVAVFLDGIYLGAKPGLNIAQLDLERIEVLKGPQSARYGRGAFAGAINYVSREPTEEVIGRVSTTVGTDGRFDAFGTISGPLTDTLYGRIGAGYASFDGTYDNQIDLFSGAADFPRGSGTTDINGREDRTLNGSLVFDPGTGLKLRANVFYNENERAPGAWRYYRNNCGNPHFSGEVRFFCGKLPGLGENDLSLDSRAPGLETESLFASFLASYDYDNGMSLSWLTGVNGFEASGFEPNERVQLNEAADDPTTGFAADDGNRYSLEILRSPIASPSEVDEWSTELRLQSSTDNSLRWEIGGYYAESEFDLEVIAWLDRSELPPGVSLVQDPLIFRLNPIPGTNGDFAYQQLGSDELEQASIFGSVEYDFSDRLTGGLELRYAEETVSQFPLINVTPVSDPRLLGREETFSYVAPRLTLDYAASDNQLVYASVAKGVKPGGFNSRGLDDELTFDQEENWTAEVGLKSSWLDRRLRTNFAVYYTDWTDLQFLTPSRIEGLSFNVTANIAGASALGAEAEIDFQVTDAFRVGFNYAYADSEYDSGTVDPGAIAPCDGTPDCSQFVGGNQLPRYSKHQAAGYLQFATPISGDMEFFARTDASYRSKQFAETTNSRWVGERTLVNAKIGVRSNNWEVSLWGENLTDEDEAIAEVFAPRATVFLFIPQAVYGDLRRYGITATYRF